MQKSTSQAYAAVARAVAVATAFALFAVNLPAAECEPGGPPCALERPCTVTTSATVDDPTCGVARLIVGYRPDTWRDRGEVQAHYGVSRRYSFPAIHAEVYQTSPARLNHLRDSLSRDPRVAFVEADREIPMALNELQWNFENTGQRGGLVDADVDGPEAWAITSDCHSVTVAVIDTGMDIAHPDLVDNLWSNPGEVADYSISGVDDDANGFVDDVHGWNFRDDSNDVRDLVGHGTHVAGIIGADEKTDMAVLGVCRDVQLMPVVAFGFKMGLTSDVVAGFMYALQEGADVINCSFEGYHGSPLFDRALDYADDMSVLVVLAAGNDAINLDQSASMTTELSPDSEDVARDNVLVVAATDRYDELADYSNYGRNSVHLGAPGSSIYSTFPPSTYRSLSGTSMAAPHVSGAAAMLLSRDPCLTPTQLRTILMASTDPLESLEGVVASGGRLNLYTALMDTPLGCQ